MCGIAGFMRTAPLSVEETAVDLRRMARALRHRGPDDEGLWHDAAGGVAFCHRRLSIIDLSPLGHQPMTSASGRFTITLNGEIYNYRELRSELLGLGHAFRGSSDTEVFLAALDQWGLQQAIARSVGMYAFAVWDRAERVLYLARDRFGEKPLYYGQCGGTFLFGSELKALRQHSRWESDIDRDALALLLRHSFIPAPRSIFANFRKVRPGCILSVRVRKSRFELDESEYWTPSAVMEQSMEHGRMDSPDQAVELVHDVLRQAVHRQMVADVPIGAFLSGGVDSSLVVALMQRLSDRPVRTFSIGFSEHEFNEAPFASRIADHLGTQHTELMVTPSDALAVIPRLPQIYDEPFADSSQVPTFLVCSLARQWVTVSLSGDGGDELFAGYKRYQRRLRAWRSLQRYPAALRMGATRLLDQAPLESLNLATRPLKLAKRWRPREDLGDRLREHALRMGVSSAVEFYRVASWRWKEPCRAVIGATIRSIGGHSRDELLRRGDDIQRMMHEDTCGYLPDDILVKVDRAAMAVGLETRVPFLDPDVARSAWRFPSEIHCKDGSGKWILRRILERYVPKSMFERQKMGFRMPVAKWLRAELRPWAVDLLDANRLRSDGYFDASVVQRRWQQHDSGTTSWGRHLWNVLMFQAWWDDWKRSTTTGLGA